MHNTNNDDLEINGATVGRRAFLGYLSGAIAVGALSGPLSALAQAGSNTLRVGANANPSSLDPATGGAGSDHVFLFPLYDTLVTWDYDTLEPRPGLARDWTFSDPKTLTLHLVPGVTFHDGTRLDAQAVKTNLDRARSAEFSNIRADLASVAEVVVEDALTVTLNLKSPDTALPLILSDRAGMMVSPTALKNNDNRVDRKPVGAGFMHFDHWNDGSEVAMRRFDNYRNKRPQLDAITFKIISDSATRLRAVMSGQADVAYQLDGRQKMLIDRSPRLQGTTASTIYCYQLYFNSAREPLTDPRVRQAINYAINRNAFVQATMAGAGEPAYMNLPKSHWAYDSNTAELYSHDPDKARALLKEAGYPDGIELDMRGYNDQSSAQMQEVLLAQFRKANIHGRFRTGILADMSAAYFGREKQGDILLSAWTGRPDPSLSYALMYAEDTYFNAGHVAPPDGFNEALLASRSTDDQTQRKKALARVQYLVMDNALVAPLAFRQSIIAASPLVQHLSGNLLGKPKFKDVSLKG